MAKEYNSPVCKMAVTVVLCGGGEIVKGREESPDKEGVGIVKRPKTRAAPERSGGLAPLHVHTIFGE